ncbi:hypothetical protein CsSME_00039301 [Camellia sinensis var. sinensis]
MLGIESRLVDMYKEAYEIHVYWCTSSSFMVFTQSSGRICPCLALYLTGVEVPKYVETVTPEYKPKFDALLVELKEADATSLKESARLEKEIVEVQELKQKISTMTTNEYFEKHPEVQNILFRFCV